MNPIQAYYDLTIVSPLPQQAKPHQSNYCFEDNVLKIRNNVEQVFKKVITFAVMISFVEFSLASFRKSPSSITYTFSGCVFSMIFYT